MSHIKELKTTITGVILFVFGVVYFAFTYFSDRELWEVNNLYLAAMIGGGVLLILAPDRMIDFVFGWMSSKADVKKD
jgi:hypothetical protein